MASLPNARLGRSPGPRAAPSVEDRMPRAQRLERAALAVGDPVDEDPNALQFARLLPGEDVALEGGASASLGAYFGSVRTPFSPSIPPAESAEGLFASEGGKRAKANVS